MTAGNMTIPSTSPGASGTSTITITATQGYSGTVTLTANASSLNAGYALAATRLAIASNGSATTTISIQTIAASLQSGTQGNSQGGTNRLIGILEWDLGSFSCSGILNSAGNGGRYRPACSCWACWEH